MKDIERNSCEGGGGKAIEKNSGAIKRKCGRGGGGEGIEKKQW